MKDYKKKYENALNAARKFKNDCPSLWDTKSNPFKGVFEELEESEDERIRKALIHYFSEQDGILTAINGSVSIGDILAWLEKQVEQKPQGKQKLFNNDKYQTVPVEILDRLYESEKELERLKQGEQKTVSKTEPIVEGLTTEFQKQVSHLIASAMDKEHEYTKGYVEWVAQSLLGYAKNERTSIDEIKPKFKVGDWVVSPNGVHWHIDSINNNRYEVSSTNGACADWPLDTDLYHLWTIQDAKDGDVLTNKNGAIFINAGSSNEGGTLDCYCYISVQNEFCIEEHKTGSWFYKDDIKPATKEQRDLLFFKMKEAGYEWDAEKKELRKIKQEQTELPNDEDYGIDSLYHAARILEKTLGDVEGYQSDDGILEHKCAIEAVNRLYKQKPAWSERDENEYNHTLKILKLVAVEQETNGYNNLIGSINWLKSLKERMKGE